MGHPKRFDTETAKGLRKHGWRRHLCACAGCAPGRHSEGEGIHRAASDVAAEGARSRP